MGSYTRKALEAHITLAEGGYRTPDGQTANTKIVRLGMDVSIGKPGGAEKNKCKIRMFNMPLADMELLTTLAFRPLQAAKNTIAVYAGDDESGLSLAFSGDIVSAVPNFNAAPDPGFDLDCITGYVASITPVPPLTAPGGQDVGALMATLAAQMELAYLNRGVDVRIRNPALVGGPMEQARQLARAADIDLIVDDGEMIITPRGGLREDDGRSTVVWSAATGMIGYPAFDTDGLVVKGLYEPRLKPGGPLRVESVVPRASGLWRVVSVEHSLQAGYPGASRWTTQVKASYPAGA